MHHAVQFLIDYGVPVLFASVMAEQAGLPIPSELLLLAAGSLARSGHMNLTLSIGVAVAACLTADGYWCRVGRRGGSKLLRKSAQISPRLGSWINRTVAAIGHHEGGMLLLAKFLPGPNLASPLAGISGLTRSRFLIFDSIASVIWAGGHTAVGYIFSKQLERITTYSSRLGTALLVGIVAAFIVARIIHRRWSQQRLRATVLVPSRHDA